MARKEKGRGLRCEGFFFLHLPVFHPEETPGDPRCGPAPSQSCAGGNCSKKGDLAGPGRRVSICECGPVALYYVLSCL